MRQSQLFTKTRKEAPKDEVSKNAELLIRAGFIHKEMAGVYALLPLGLKVIKKIENIIREEMNSLGGQEIELTALQDPDVWKKTGRWDDDTVDVWFKTKLKNDTELGLGLTHEEPLTNLLTDHINSHKDLPLLTYQFQTKFRNELRAKSGIMRGREFYMKDLYSFAKTAEEHEEIYEKVKESYKNIFERVGLGDKTYLTVADGGSFGDVSHEFQTVTEAGEDTIYINEESETAVNEEVVDNKEGLIEKKAVEVGNIFPLGTKFSDALDLKYTDEDGEQKPVYMGSYGIGLGRVMGTVAEVLSDENGLVWPRSIAPFQIHLILATPDDEEVKAYANKLYQEFKDKGVEILYDDRDKRAGEKFADSDLIGIPYRLIVGKKTLDEQTIEVKNRKTGETKDVSEGDIFKGDYLTE
ncbi:MAG: prolyl-tRNA synthetase [Candidatus Paceibacteria bacterium]|jgi:prolyl-tRNA synthetase